MRRKRWEWYVDDFSARLKPEAKRILIATRWHQEDVAGLVLEQIRKGTVKGRAISITAKAEEGDPLGRAPSASTSGTIPRATTTAPSSGSASARPRR